MPAAMPWLTVSVSQAGAPAGMVVFQGMGSADKRSAPVAGCDRRVGRDGVRLPCAAGRQQRDRRNEARHGVRGSVQHVGAL